MKNKIIIGSLLILTFFSCNKNSFKVNVELENANGRTAYLQKIIDNETINIDSIVIDNKAFTFNVKNNKNNDILHLYVKGWRRSLPFVADNKDVYIKGDFNAYNKVEIIASETQKVLDKFNRKFNTTTNDNTRKLLITDFLKNSPESVLSPYLLYRYKWAFNLNELKLAISYFPENFNTGYLGKVKEYIELLERSEVGKPYIDFTLNNIEGQAVSLSSLVGNNKLVIVDFWASWCPDCRVENPNVVAVYNDYKDKGLEIISVSMDTDKNAWLKGIEEDGLIWENHVSALKGWNCPAAAEYGVAFIPQNVLINNDGKIVAKNLNGEDLRNFVSRYLR
ncbi:MAG: AhpC/TSA family protein [Bacteroidales bacterium]|nr:AhpC/TSA family protein [Bacteroidales bacterium]